MNTQHTPGPWRHDATWSLIKHGKAEIAAIHSGNGANAALIAAAPELLAALESAEKTLRWAAQEAQGRVKSEIVGGWLHHADQARAAIAKARV